LRIKIVNFYKDNIKTINIPKIRKGIFIVYFVEIYLANFGGRLSESVLNLGNLGADFFCLSFGVFYCFTFFVTAITDGFK